MKITHSQHLTRVQAEFTATERALCEDVDLPTVMDVYTTDENNTQKCDKHLHENESLERLKTSSILYAPNYLQSSQREIIINNNSAFSYH